MKLFHYSMSDLPNMKVVRKQTKGGFKKAQEDVITLIFTCRGLMPYRTKSKHVIFTNLTLPR